MKSSNGQDRANKNDTASLLAASSMNNPSSASSTSLPRSIGLFMQQSRLSPQERKENLVRILDSALAIVSDEDFEEQEEEDSEIFSRPTKAPQQ